MIWLVQIMCGGYGEKLFSGSMFTYIIYVNIKYNIN